MASKFSVNPFNELATTAQSSFASKFFDTQRVLVGNWNIGDENKDNSSVQLGMLDYLGFGLLRLTAGGSIALGCIGLEFTCKVNLMLIHKINKISNSYLRYTSYFLSLAPQLVLLALDVALIALIVVGVAVWMADCMVRYPLGFALTLALTPIIGLVHYIQKSKNRDPLHYDNQNALDSYSGDELMREHKQYIRLETARHNNLSKQDNYHRTEYSPRFMSPLAQQAIKGENSAQAYTNEANAAIRL